MNDAQKQLLDSFQKGTFHFVQLESIHSQEKRALKLVVANQNKDIDNLIMINNFQSKTIKKQHKTITILKYVAIVQGAIFVLFAMFK